MEQEKEKGNGRREQEIKRGAQRGSPEMEQSPERDEEFSYRDGDEHSRGRKPSSSESPLRASFRAHDLSVT